MKKILISTLALLWLIPFAQAVPAYPGTYKVKQPDGSVLVLQNHGDEYYHWMTDEFGHTMQKQADGFYRTVFISPAEHQARLRGARARQPRRANSIWSSYDKPFTINSGSRKVLCLIAEFAPADPENPGEHDKFVLPDPRQHFEDMLNKHGYDYNQAIGSVRDYFLDNSIDADGTPQYLPEFDVFGPMTLSQSSAYYDRYGVHLAILEAYEALKDQIDVNQYDTDNDGIIDMVLFYYPGYNEAEGGPEETIWPHQMSWINFGMMGDKRFMHYFCTSELRGNQGQTAAGIGTTCHEFSHALGLPDFYDTDYEENGSNSVTTEYFDLMARGPYNDQGRKPPYLNAIERNMLGWMPMPETIETADSYVLEGIQGNNAYRIDTRMPGEFFVLECRNGEGWDSGLSTSRRGLVVYHVDQSERIVADGLTANYLWLRTNMINGYGGHPCFQVIPSVKPYYVFPGQRRVTRLSPEDWDGNSAGVELSDIAYTGGRSTFDLSLTWEYCVEGYVKDASGAPIADATVSLSRSHYRNSAPSRLSTDVVCQTDEDGHYAFTLASGASEEQIVTARKDGYVAESVNLTLSERFLRYDFTLMVPGQAPVAALRKYEENDTMAASSLNNCPDIAVAMRYTAAELAEMGAVGATIKNITFFTGANQGETVYLVVDFDHEIVLREDVTEQYVPRTYVTVDISDKQIVIPEGKDVYIGYGLAGIATTSPFLMFGPYDVSHGSSYASRNFLTATDWRDNAFGTRHYDFIVSADIIIPPVAGFAAHGVSYVKLVDGVPQVVPAAGKTVYGIEWYLDGTLLTEAPGAVNTLPSGAHTFMARISHYDGTSERVYYDVVAE